MEPSSLVGLGYGILNNEVQGLGHVLGSPWIQDMGPSDSLYMYGIT